MDACKRTTWNGRVRRELDKDKNRFKLFNIELVRMVAKQILKFVLATKVFILKKRALILLLGDVELNLSCRSVVK